jgi:hypothetical protein
VNPLHGWNVTTKQQPKQRKVKPLPFSRYAPQTARHWSRSAAITRHFTDSLGRASNTRAAEDFRPGKHAKSFPTSQPFKRLCLFLWVESSNRNNSYESESEKLLSVLIKSGVVFSVENCFIAKVVVFRRKPSFWSATKRTPKVVWMFYPSSCVQLIPSTLEFHDARAAAYGPFLFSPIYVARSCSKLVTKFCFFISKCHLLNVNSNSRWVSSMTAPLSALSKDYSSQNWYNLIAPRE